MRKVLAIALIVFGLAAIIGGVVMLFGLKGDNTASVTHLNSVLQINSQLRAASQSEAVLTNT